MSSRNQVIVFAVFCLFLVLANGYFFPLAMTPDSKNYLAIAREISQTMSEGGTIFDITEKFRVLGYSSLIALLGYLFGWPPFFSIYVVQAALIVVAGMVLIWTLSRLEVPFVVSAPLSLLYIAALPTLLTSFLLTDAINAALTAIAVCLLAEPLFKPSQRALLPVLLAGICIGLAFFLREANQYLFVCLLPMVFAIAYQRGRWSAGLALLLAFVAPVLIAGESYKAFNDARFGQRFVSTGGRTVMLHALMPLAKHKPEIFGSSTKLDRTARSIVRNYTFAETLQINNALVGELHDEVQLSKIAFAKYFEAWRRFPLAMARTVLERLRISKQARELLNPMQGFYTNARWRGDIEDAASSRMKTAVTNHDISGVLATLPVLAGRIPSILVFAIALLGSAAVTVIAWMRSDRVTALGLAALLLSYGGYVLVYALVNLEMRYLTGIAVILVLASAITLRTVADWQGWYSFAEKR